MLRAIVAEKTREPGPVSKTHVITPGAEIRDFRPSDIVQSRSHVYLEEPPAPRSLTG
jgi:hypothetical protein